MIEIGSVLPLLIKIKLTTLAQVLFQEALKLQFMIWQLVLLVLVIFQLLSFLTPTINNSKLF
jgi:hypothetical protein